MYSANLHDQLINAAYPLKPLTAWAGGACTVTVAVPPAQSLAGITVESVTVALTLPTGAVVTQAATPVADSPNWAATFAAENFATSGFVAEGFTVNLVGKDETGTARVWIVSKGDLEIKPGDASPSSSGSYVVVKLRDAAPSTPVGGDAYISGGRLLIYDGSAWQAIGGSSVEIDPTLTVQGAAADAKAVGDALAGKRDVLDLGVRGTTGANSWFVVNGTKLTVDNGSWVGGAYKIEPSSDVGSYDLYVENAEGETFDYVGTFELDANYSAVVLTYHIACCVDSLAKESQIPSVPSAYTGTPAMDGVGAAGSSGAWACGDHVHPTDTSRAAATDLPYTQVTLTTPTKWVFSGVEDWFEITHGPDYDADLQGWILSVADVNGHWIDDRFVSGTADATSLTFTVTDPNEVEADATVVATKTGYALSGRASCKLTTSSEATLVHPSALGGGRLRDFIVRLVLSGSSVPSITFADPTGETITYETDGDDFPVPDEVGTWLYAFTETDDGVFDVSLKKVNTVAQGGGT